ncbi:MAG TPA: hypothetical protein VI455_10000 [Terriglobia bacterium]
MAADSFLSDKFLDELTAVGEVDVLVGIPTANHADTVAPVLTTLQIGLVKYFPRARCMLVNADAQSSDGTADAVATAFLDSRNDPLEWSPLRTMHRLATSYHPNLGKGGAWRIFATAADLLRAKACAIFSPDLEAVTPEWVSNLIRPVYKDGFDLVAPVYQRPKFGGLLIKNVVSPMVGGVYGRSLREPAGTEIGLSGKLASQLLTAESWQEEAVQSAPELWATTTALASRWRVGQAYLGPKAPKPGRSSPDLVASIRQVVGPLFRFMELHAGFWMDRKDSEAVANLELGPTVTLEPVHVQREQMLQTFRRGITELDDIIAPILSHETLAEIKALSASKNGDFAFPDELWVKTVYDFAASYHRSVINRDHLLQALAPLYQGRIGAFVAENEQADPEGLNERLEQLSRRYEQDLPYLIKRWATES